MALPPGIRLGPYEITGQIGVGGMGEVYRATDTNLKRQVAIKVLLDAVATDSARLARFQREAEVLASLNHPNIAAIHGLERADGQTALVMELVDGPTLADRIAQGPIPLDEALPIARQIADALEAAHERAVIHRDLKPANIKVRPDGTVKVLDFGLAKAMEPAASSSPSMSMSPTITTPAMTQAGMILGTAAYMSPEQARGKVADTRSDIWAFGVVLYELLTGTSPFRGESVAETIGLIVTTAPDLSVLPSATPARIREVLRRCLTKDPRQRLRDIGEARIAIDATLAGTDEDPITPPHLALPAWRRMLPWSVAAAAVLVAIVLAVRSYESDGRSRRSPATDGASIENLQVEQLTTSGNAERPSISPDGKNVAYIQRDGNNTSVWVRQIATSRNVQIVSPVVGREIRAVTVSPDGAYVDFVRAEPGQPSALWRVEFLGGIPKRLIDRVESPVSWSPDGKRLAFVRLDRERVSTAVVVADADGGTETEIARSQLPLRFLYLGLLGTGAVAPVWSPDGARVAVLQSPVHELRKQSVAVIDLVTREERVLPTGGVLGQGLGWLDNDTLVVGNSLDPGAPSQLWRLTYPEGRRTRLTNDINRYTAISLSADRNVLVTTRPDMRASVWVADAATLHFGEVIPPSPFVAAGPSNARVAWLGTRLLYEHSANGRYWISSVIPGVGMPESLIVGTEPAGTSDGQAIVYVSDEVGERVGLWRVDGDGRRPVPLVPAGRAPLVTPDNREVVYLSERDGPPSPWRVPIGGGMGTRITSSAGGTDNRPEVSPDAAALLLVTTQGGEVRWIICEFPQCTKRDELPALGIRPQWTPDGLAVAYIDPETRSNLWVRRLDRRPNGFAFAVARAQQITHFSDGRIVGDYAWSHDRKQLAMSRVSVSSDIVLFKGLQGHQP